MRMAMELCKHSVDELLLTTKLTCVQLCTWPGPDFMCGSHQGKWIKKRTRIWWLLREYGSVCTFLNISECTCMFEQIT